MAARAAAPAARRRWPSPAAAAPCLQTQSWTKTLMKTLMTTLMKTLTKTLTKVRGFGVRIREPPVTCKSTSYNRRPSPAAAAARGWSEGRSI
eukprot:6803556-Pyramimonas_sp.AAC.1